MSEHDANRALLDTARLRIVDDPLEQTQCMPVVDRRYRQAEARSMRTGRDPLFAGRSPDFRDDQPAQDYLSQAARRGFTDE